GVFNSQAARWDKSTCGGGLKWQIFALNNGYDYKNTISNGCFFNLAARLALYTKNHTYAEWATTTWDWTEAIGLISTKDWQVYDGADDMINCSKVNHEQWSYNAGIYLHGAAAMYNLTNGDHIWAERVQGLISGLRTFFMTETDIMHETTCERTNNCLVDQRSFKAYLARWIAATTQLVPWTYHQLMPKIRASAQAAAQACSGGDTHRACGLRWTTGAYDGSTGVGEEMAALEVIQSLLVPFVEGPSSISSGGTSKGDPNAGSDDATAPNVVKFNKITSSDQAGAGILTALVIFGIVMGTYWAMNP
ncbi:hydrolase 76 protein, partial [Ascosphaera atra]